MAHVWPMGNSSCLSPAASSSALSQTGVGNDSTTTECQEVVRFFSSSSSSSFSFNFYSSLFARRIMVVEFRSFQTRVTKNGWSDRSGKMYMILIVAMSIGDCYGAIRTVKHQVIITLRG